MVLEATTSEAIADWIETSLVVSESGHFGSQKLAQLANDEVGVNEAQLDIGIGVMRRRALALSDNYPFAVNDVAVLRRSSRMAIPYTTLLYLTPDSPARQTVRVTETSEMGELFEGIAEFALANFWGVGGDAIRFAHPSRHGRPKEFDLAIPWLAKKIGVTAGRGYRPPRRKDGGVDVVAWRRFSDGRPGFPIALAQCTIQRETFTKTTDIDVRLWASWLAMDADPLSLLVIPGTVRAAGPEWGQLASVVMPIERLRIVELLARDPTFDVISDQWTSDTSDGLREVLGGAEL